MASSTSSSSSSSSSWLLASPIPLYTTATALRIIFLLYGLWQDANSPLKYTDIDYLVFTDATRFVASHHYHGPYARETYRYTPLLSWMLLPTTWVSPSRPWLTVAYFSFGKILFALADLVAGWLIVKVLLLSTQSLQRRQGRDGGRVPTMDAARARKFAAIWLLNPMVATISTRGSSEGLLAVMVMALLWAVLTRKVTLAAFLLGLGVHFKIYPFIYAPAIVWWMDDENMTMVMTRGEGGGRVNNNNNNNDDDDKTTRKPFAVVAAFFTAARMRLTILSLATFLGLNLAMYAVYAHPFLQHTYLHHVTRIDHRHNFSPYNILLYLVSAQSPLLSSSVGSFRIESLAFVPQLLLSCVLIPFVMAKKDLPTTMLAQTWTFVTFNKVCTSQVCFLTPFIPTLSLGKLHDIETGGEKKQRKVEEKQADQDNRNFLCSTFSGISSSSPSTYPNLPSSSARSWASPP